MNEVLKRIQERRSCRAFDGTPTDGETLHSILEAGRYAPSACNVQPWHFYACTGESLEKAKALLNAKFAGAGAVIFVAEAEKPLPFSPENRFRQMDLGLAMMQMALAAASLEVDSCIVGSFDMTGAAELLRLPEGQKLQLALVLGHAAADAFTEKTRLPAQEVYTVCQ